MKKTPALVVSAGLLLSSCSTQLLTNLATTTTKPVATTTTIPTGDVKSLLNEMLTAVTGLGDSIVAKDNDRTRTALSTVESVWIALEPGLAGLDKMHGTKPIDTGLVDDVQRIVNLVRSGIKRKRPADADKAARFLPLVINALD